MSDSEVVQLWQLSSMGQAAPASGTEFVPMSWPGSEPQAMPEPEPVVEEPEVIVAQARAKGYELGKWEGMEHSWEEVQQMVKRFIVMLEEMSHPFRSLDNRVAKELTQLAMLAAEQIVRRELQTDSKVVEDVIEDALETLSKLEGDIEVYIHPQDFELAEKAAERTLEGKTWKIVSDPALLPGGCRVRTPTSFIDASVENRLETLFSFLNEDAEKLVGED